MSPEKISTWELSRRMTDQHFFSVLSKSTEQLTEENINFELWETNQEYSDRVSFIIAFDFKQDGMLSGVRYSVDRDSRVTVEYSIQGDDQFEQWQLLEIEDTPLEEILAEAIQSACSVNDFTQDIVGRAQRISTESLVN